VPSVLPAHVVGILILAQQSKCSIAKAWVSSGLASTAYRQFPAQNCVVTKCSTFRCKVPDKN
jgi:hypothetical protein